jgi:hypothetical protein
MDARARSSHQPAKVVLESSVGIFVGKPAVLHSSHAVLFSILRRNQVDSLDYHSAREWFGFNHDVIRNVQYVRDESPKWVRCHPLSESLVEVRSKESDSDLDSTLSTDPLLADVPSRTYVARIDNEHERASESVNTCQNDEINLTTTKATVTSHILQLLYSITKHQKIKMNKFCLVAAILIQALSMSFAFGKHLLCLCEVPVIAAYVLTNYCPCRM